MPPNRGDFRENPERGRGALPGFHVRQTHQRRVSDRADSTTLLTVGDRLAAGLGLTSARWQILGAITSAERPQPVAWLARDLGANRQNVQRIVNDLHKEGLVAFEVNPHHRRAQLVTLTEKGRRTFEAAMEFAGALGQRPL